MKQQKLPFGRVVSVFWLDSKSETGWGARDSPKELGKVVSIGYITSCDGNGLSLSTSIATDGQSLDDVSIPWGAIIDLRKVGEEWDRV